MLPYLLSNGADHEILINAVTIYLKISDAAHVRLNQKGNPVKILV
jgi:hypothetical protein